MTLVSQETLSLVDSVAGDYFERSINEAGEIDHSYQHLWENLYQLFQAGGKRLRPQMLLLAYEAFGGEDIESVAPIAAAHELLHFALLIHDDIIDRDYIRYGVTNISGQYKMSYSQYVLSREDAAHYGHGTAILAGDLMLSAAYQLIAASSLDSKNKALAQQLLSLSVFEVAGGELLDTEASFMPYKKGRALKVARYKTAGYSFISPLLTGASLACQLNEKQREAIKNYATPLGIAYQLTDDILGIFGDEEKTGKSTVGDIIEGKRTYMIELALETFSPADQATFMMVFGNPHATPLEVETAKKLLVSSGALHDVEQKIEQYTIQAKSSLESLDLSPDYRKKFVNIVEKATKRSS